MFFAFGFMILTFISLFLGLLFFSLGGNLNRKFSNQLMIMRVTFQFLSIIAILILLVIYS